jgi:nucleotide-binding universal stress UspA family protein
MCKKREQLPQSDRPSFFVTGLTGRKKANAFDKKVVGSLTLMAAGHLLIPHIVIKLDPIVDRPRVFVIAVKDLDKTSAPYDLTLDLVKAGNGDKVFIVYIYNDDKVRTMEVKAKLDGFNKYYGKRLAEDGLVRNGSKFYPVISKPGVPAYKQILEVCDELAADYVVINPHVQVNGAFVPNSCEKIVIEAECNVVVCHK